MKYELGRKITVLLVFGCAFLMGAALLVNNIDGISITGNQTYTDPNEIAITNSTVEPGGSLTLKAGRKIILGSGFHAKDGSELIVQIDFNLGGMANLPPNQANNRFFSDQLVNKRPALSIRGFDSGVLMGGASYGYGLKPFPKNV